MPSPPANWSTVCLNFPRDSEHKLFTKFQFQSNSKVLSIDILQKKKKIRKTKIQISNMGFKNTLRFLAFLCFRMCFFVSIDAQVPIPQKLDGFWYENRPSEADSIFIEAFFDPVCPDSRDSWPGLKQALHHYGSRVTLLVHTFPLP